MKINRIWLLLVIIALVSCGTMAGTGGAVIEFEDEYLGLPFLVISSPAMEGNTLGDSGDRTVALYLPPDYDSGARAYPVVYFLHGYDQTAFLISKTDRVLDEWFAENPEDAFIVVGVDGANPYGGTFYADSPVTGAWERHFLDELIPIIESRFRIIASRETRGIAGFSMGGYGAWELGLRHPDLFSAMLALSPGVFAAGELQDVLTDGSWGGPFRRAYGSVFAPRPGEDPPCAIPVFDGSPGDAAVIKAWESGFGDVRAKVDVYLAGTERLSHVSLVYGSADYYPWLPRGVRFFSGVLSEKGIDHEIVDHGGGHLFNFETAEEYLLPFFVEAFSGSH